jgi:hypothetical protein
MSIYVDYLWTSVHLADNNLGTIQMDFVLSDCQAQPLLSRRRVLIC